MALCNVIDIENTDLSFNLTELCNVSENTDLPLDPTELCNVSENTDLSLGLTQFCNNVSENIDLSDFGHGAL